MAGNNDVDRTIARLLECRTKNPGRYVRFVEKTIIGLIKKARAIFMSESMLLEVHAPITVVGDIHGQFFDLLRLFETAGDPPTSDYLFLGDYVDRGDHSVETFILLLCYKIKYPNGFFLLRGDHECPRMSGAYGFFNECKQRYSVDLWHQFMDCFSYLPVAATINGKYFCVHGGLSPDLTSMDEIRRLPRLSKVPDHGIMCDLLWADPDRDIKGWGPNERGVSYTFGPDVVDRFIANHKFELIVRAHQVVENGFEFSCKRQLLTIFSAPNYCGTFGNDGAIMYVDDKLNRKFSVLKPIKKKAAEGGNAAGKRGGAKKSTH